MKFEDLKPGDHYITTTTGMSGHFAVEIWLNNEDPDMVFEEPWNTGIGRYRSKAEAVAEAVRWAKDENLPYFP